MNYKDYKHEYIMTSERMYSDEIQNSVFSNKVLSVGDYLILDGIKWFVDEVVR